MEIGSIFEVEPSTVRESVEADALRLCQVDKYGKRNQCFTASGREAIELALISLERERPEIRKRCLMPAYMCDSVFIPFVRRGWELVFYPVDSDLETAGEELVGLALENDPGLLFIHPYFGADTCKGVRTQIASLRKRGILLMEDVTQSYYLKEAGQDADFVVGSLRKWYAVPDGGFVVSDFPLAEDILESGDDYARERLIPLVRKWEYLMERQEKDVPPAGLQAEKEAFLKRNRALEEDLDRYQGVRRMSRVSATILAGMNESAAAGRRAENYRLLYEKIRGMKRLWPVLGGGKEAAGLYLPIYARERDGLQRFLGERGIYAPVLWPIGEENRDCLRGEETYIFEHMLALPVDQRYGAAQMEEIAATLSLYEEQPVIGIRTDANDEVATGHVMRCITIARRLKNMGCQVIFFTADKEAKETLLRAGMEQICLNTEWNRMEEEVPRFKEILGLSGVKILLVDSYQATPAYFEKLGDRVRLAYIDDCFDAVYPVELLINYNAYHTRFPYEETYGGKTKLLLGTEYVPLREEFAATEDAREKVEGQKAGFDLLVASGGTDAWGAVLGVLEKASGMEAFQNVTFHAVVGVYHPQGDAIEEFARTHENVKVYRPCLDMAGLMAVCDAAVSAAGTMLFELCAMRVPTVFFQSADNQRYDREFFEKEDRMLFAGDIRQDKEACVKALCEGLGSLLTDKDRRRRMREKLSEVTDGQGAWRIAEEIVKL